MSLTILIIIQYACSTLLFFVNGFTLYNVITLICATMFAVRKVGIDVKLEYVMTLEVISLFFCIAWRVLFKGFTWPFLIWTLVSRIVFIIVYYYDSKAYVYISEEKRKYD